MHDCRQTQASLIDLLFDETDAATRARLLAEVGRCAACAAEYRSFGATLAACDEASAALAPAESYWPQYHAALARRLHDTQAARVPLLRAPFWKRLLTASVRVPAPLAAAIVLLLVVTSVFTLALVARAAPEPIVLAAPDTRQLAAAPEIKFVEVPVVREKVVTKIIYVPRGGGDGGGDHAGRKATRENLAGVGRHNAPLAPVADAPIPLPNLSGFKPAGEVKLRIIKGGDAREP
jgi:anti-sigma factor RsiW